MSISIIYYRFNKEEKKLLKENYDFKEKDNNTLFLDDSIKMIYNKIINNLYNERKPVDRTHLYCWYVSQGKAISLGFKYTDKNIKMIVPVIDIKTDNKFIDKDGVEIIQSIDNNMNNILLNYGKFKNKIYVVDIYEMMEYLKQTDINEPIQINID